MPSKRILRTSIEPLCGEVGPEDGIDPKERHRNAGACAGAARPRRARAGQGGLPEWVRLPDGSPPPPKPDRKAQQLGRQVARTLDALFAGECRDEPLRGLRVVSVVPAPDASNLLVTVAPAEPLDPALLLAHLARASGWLRAEVAATITRRKAPSLCYRVEGN